jgi:hypothetical protein
VNAAWVLLGYAGVVGFLAPRLLLRSSWPYRAPALAVAAWLALSVSFTVTIALAAHRLAAPTEHFHAGVIGLLHSCGLTADTATADPAITARLAVLLPAVVALLVLSSFAFELWRGLRLRSRHRRVLDLVGRRSARLRATVLDHELPAAY